MFLNQYQLQLMDCWLIFIFNNVLRLNLNVIFFDVHPLNEISFTKIYNYLIYLFSFYNLFYFGFVNFVFSFRFLLWRFILLSIRFLFLLIRLSFLRFFTFLFFLLFLWRSTSFLLLLMFSTFIFILLQFLLIHI